MSDLDIVQQYANQGKLSELPAGRYVVAGTIRVPAFDEKCQLCSCRVLSDEWFCPSCGYGIQRPSDSDR